MSDMHPGSLVGLRVSAHGCSALLLSVFLPIEGPEVFHPGLVTLLECQDTVLSHLPGKPGHLVDTLATMGDQPLDVLHHEVLLCRQLMAVLGVRGQVTRGLGDMLGEVGKTLGILDICLLDWPDLVFTVLLEALRWLATGLDVLTLFDTIFRLFLRVLTLGLAVMVLGSGSFFVLGPEDPGHWSMGISTQGGPRDTVPTQGVPGPKVEITVSRTPGLVYSWTSGLKDSCNHGLVGSWAPVIVDS